MWVPWEFYWNADSDSIGPGRGLRLCISNKPHPHPHPTGWCWHCWSIDHTVSCDDWEWGAVEKSCGAGAVSPCWACCAFQNEMLEEGHEYAVMLYTWRSCSRAIPQVRQSCPFRGCFHPAPHPRPDYWPSPGPLTQGGALKTFGEHPVKLTPAFKNCSVLFSFESSIC